MNTVEYTAHELARLIRSGEIRAEEAVRSLLENITTCNGATNAYLRWDGERALEAARAVDAKITAGEDPGPLAGVPVAIKDNLCVFGDEVTCGSRILEGFISPYDATVIRNLRSRGAIPLGRTNMDEFAMGSSNETSFFGPVRNPWNLEAVPGGSSGGSATAVASGTAFMALGSDTGGSIRQPASLCGVVGMKPTYGRVSRYGLVAFASSLDQIGPIARNTRDAALLLESIEGHDVQDSTSTAVPGGRYLEEIEKGVEGLVFGLPKEYFMEGLAPEVEAAVMKGVRELEKMGGRVQEVSLPHTKYAVAAYYIIATAEASSNLARYDGVQYGYRADSPENLLDLYERTRSEGFGSEVKRRIILGTYVLSSGYYDAYYLKAQKVRTLIKQDFDLAFEKVDALVTPTSPTPAFRLGEKLEDPLQMYLSDIFTNSANLAGIPGVSFPCGLSGSGLPIGIQVLGPPFSEGALFRIGYALESAGLFPGLPQGAAGAGGGHEV